MASNLPNVLQMNTLNLNEKFKHLKRANTKRSIITNLTCKRKCYILMGVAIILLCINWLSVATMRSNYEYDKTTTYVSQSALFSRKKPEMKYILQWTRPDLRPFIFWGKGQTEFRKRNCTVNQCYVTPDRLLLNSITDYDAVAFHGRELIRYYPSPKTRSKHQKYIYVSIESSHNYKVCNEIYDGFFNWTWTYRLDSNVPYAYIAIRNVNGDIIGPKQSMHWIDVHLMKPINDQFKERLKTKKKAAAWFASHCKTKSKREVFAHSLHSELENYDLQLDIFGICGEKKCPMAKMDDCLQMIERDYYFYLSLENSFAEDYVTEKLLWPLQHYAVPVVFGGANYTRFMPDGIYLHGGKLGPKALAKKMFDIINDKERYYSFFKWHNHYSYHARDESPDSDDHCRMCEMLHDEALMKTTTVYKDFRKWWNVPGQCKH